MTRKFFNFNSDWKFTKLPKAGGLFDQSVQEPDFDDSTWQSITLPHTWNAEDGASGRTGICEGGENYYRGLACYRMRFSLDENVYSGKRFFLEFKGANTVAEVFINGSFVGKHEGGYSAFRFDISEYVKAGDNIAAVKVNNAPTDCIAPITNQGDFTKMGGLYRDVRLIAVDPLHIDLTDYGSSGVYITPKNIEKASADIHILAKLSNDNREEKTAVLIADIYDMNNNIVSAKSLNIIIGGSEKANAELSLKLENPILWNGRENPYLYTAKISVSSNGITTDELSQSFGIRTYRIDKEEGFFLNGSYLDLRGANYHQDSYENGWAMTDEQRRRDYEIMLDMGCSAVRMAHYQHHSHEYDLCDSMGLAVWTELGIVNKVSADETEELKISPVFAENAKTQLTELIRQNYNHPSVIVWGISNELYQMSECILSLYGELAALARKEDETRLITFADNQAWGKFLELPTDVVGYNKYFGWYKEAGAAEDFGKWLDAHHAEKESRPMCMSEYGGGGAISQHKDNIDWLKDVDPWGTPHYENYQSALHEKIWAQFAQRKYLWGKFIWCMFDFASDGREEGDTKGQNDKGLVTREREPKDAYYFYKSVWSNAPMVHLTEKRFFERSSVIPQIKAYSNAQCAELFINGISQGRISAEELDPLNPTVFVWKNRQIETGKSSAVTVKATFSEGTVLEDSALWIGC